MSGIDGTAAAVEDHWRRLERMYHSSPANAELQARVEVGDGTARIVMPVGPSCFHGAGAVHGHVYFKLLDDVAGYAVFSVEREVVPPTTTFTVHFLRPVTGGVLEAVATVVGRSPSAYVAEARLNRDGVLVGSGSGVYTRSRTPVASMPGYAEPFS